MPSFSFFSGGQMLYRPSRVKPPINANRHQKSFILVPPARPVRAGRSHVPAPGAPASSLIPGPDSRSSPTPDPA